MSEDSIDARESQGFVNHPKGNVEQDFGDKFNYDTGGGDAAGRNIDKRTFINIILPGVSSGNVSPGALPRPPGARGAAAQGGGANGARWLM